MLEIPINSISNLEDFAIKLAHEINPGSVILLNGEMGSGKTSFVQAFAKALGINEPVRSPTFIIHSEYAPVDGSKVHHIDLYRVATESELNELKISESINNASYIFIEWADKFEKELSDIFKTNKKYKLDFEIIDENKRLIKFTEI